MSAHDSFRRRHSQEPVRHMHVSDSFMIAALFASLAPAPAAARSPIQTQRLMATSVPLNASPNSSVLAAVWQDRLMAERKKLSALSSPSAALSWAASNVSVTAFAASFVDGDTTIILSALYTTPECQNLSGAAAPNVNNCPVRIAVLENGHVKVVASVNDFPFIAALKEVGNEQGNLFDNRTSRDQTLVSFDRATHEITTLLILNGVRDNEKSIPIQVAY